MGSRATRITREELLTPPEFRGFPQAGHQAGRVGGARSSWSAAATRLAWVRATSRFPCG